MKRTDYLPEKKIKRILEKYVSSFGWEQEHLRFFIDHNNDIEVRRGRESWIIGIKAKEPSNREVNSIFISTLGRILQRMDDQNCKYSIAFPDTKQFRRLWERLPQIAKQRMKVTVLFVNQTGIVDEIAE